MTFDIDPKALALLTFATIGAIKLFRAVINAVTADDKQVSIANWLDAGVIVTSTITGAVFAASAGVTPFMGGLIGLNASGIVTTAQNVGGNLKGE